MLREGVKWLESFVSSKALLQSSPHNIKVFQLSSIPLVQQFTDNMNTSQKTSFVERPKALVLGEDL